jgi:hypothetical protein
MRAGEMKNALHASMLALALASATACASASAKGRSEGPPLSVPPAPARIIEPAPEPLPEPVSELPTTSANTVTTPASSRPNRSAAKPPAADPKANETKPTEPPPPDPAPVPQPPVQPPAQLRTPQTADAENAIRAIRTTVDRASALLNGIDYGPLSKVRKKAYDDAKRFIMQADEAVKQGNYVFAQAVATKAETLARELAGK